MTKVINFFGSAGAGKSTQALGLAYNLKMKGLKVEYISEYAKELVFSNCSHILLSEQLHVYSEQIFKMRIRSNLNLDYLVTDSPTLLSLYYGEKYGANSKELSALILSEYNSYENINYFLNRNAPFDPVGRIQNEKESDNDSIELEHFLNLHKISFESYQSNDSLSGYLTYKILTEHSK